MLYMISICYVCGSLVVVVVVVIGNWFMDFALDNPVYTSYVGE